MTLEKVNVVDRIEVIENGCVQVRVRQSIMEDGKMISGTYHRHVVSPGEDYSKEDGRVRAICSAVHTPEVIEAYKAAIAAQGV
jgi:hypothetical protein